MENISKYETLVAIFGSLVQILANQGCGANRGTTKMHIADSNSILFITCGIQENGGNP